MKLMKRNRNHFPTFSSMLNPFFDDDFFNFSSQMKSFDEQMPAINVKENDNNFELEVAAPGMKKSDFKIEVNNDVLTISSENEVDNEVKEDNYTRREFSYSSFTRSFTLPENVDSEKIKAEYKDGILSLHIPKLEMEVKDKVRKIDIS